MNKLSNGCKSEPLRLAVLGGGVNSAVGSAHIAALRLEGGYKIQAGCFSREKEENTASGEAYGVTEIYSDLPSMLKSNGKNIDAVLILTPTDQHFNQIKYCLENGFAVISEKALACSVSEVSTLMNLEKDCGGLITVTYNYTGYPMIREMEAQISSGRLGKIFSVNASMPQEGFVRKDAEGKPIFPQDWRLVDAEIPTISLDLGVHLTNMVGFLSKKSPLEVVAMARSCGNFPNIVDSINALCRYSDDLAVNYWFTKSALGYRNGLSLEVFGTLGSLRWVQEFPEQLLFSNSLGSVEVLDRASPSLLVASDKRYARFKPGHPSGFIEAFANYYSDLRYALLSYLSNKPHKNLGSYVFGSESALEGLKVLGAMQVSARARKWVEIGGQDG